MRERTGLFRRVLAAVFVIVIGLVLIEAGLRFYGWALLRQRDRARLPQDAYTLICLGESTTMLGGEQAYPQQLENILREKYPAKKIRVLNKGLAGQNSDRILAELPALLEKYRPDMLVVMMGINDSGEILKRRTLLARWVSDLRTVKLVRLAGRALSKKNIWQEQRPASGVTESEKGGFTEDILLKDLAGTSEGFRNAALAAFSYLRKKEYAKAEVFLRWLLKNNECSFCEKRFLRELAVTLQKQKKHRELLPIIPVFPHWLYDELSLLDFCEDAQLRQDILQILQQKAHKDAQAAPFYDLQAQCYRSAGKEQKAQRAKDAADQIRKTRIHVKTQANYLKLHEIALKAGIPVVYVQYPLLSPEPLRQIFSGKPGFRKMTFVDNKAVFEQLVQKQGYKTYFSDRFAGAFGHCTSAGNRILAENIARVIEKKGMIR
ncbi:MAG: SGNH/GDSL hydrolase family protein [Candidatus Omnitrophota bacterium]